MKKFILLFVVITLLLGSFSLVVFPFGSNKADEAPEPDDSTNEDNSGTEGGEGTTAEVARVFFTEYGAASVDGSEVYKNEWVEFELNKEYDFEFEDSEYLVGGNIFLIEEMSQFKDTDRVFLSGDSMISTVFEEAGEYILCSDRDYIITYQIGGLLLSHGQESLFYQSGMYDEKQKVSGIDSYNITAGDTRYTTIQAFAFDDVTFTASSSSAESAIYYLPGTAGTPVFYDGFQAQYVCVEGDNYSCVNIWAEYPNATEAKFIIFNKNCGYYESIYINESGPYGLSNEGEEITISLVDMNVKYAIAFGNSYAADEDVAIKIDLYRDTDNQAASLSTSLSDFTSQRILAHYDVREDSSAYVLVSRNNFALGVTYYIVLED